MVCVGLSDKILESIPQSIKNSSSADDIAHDMCTFWTLSKQVPYKVIFNSTESYQRSDSTYRMHSLIQVSDYKISIKFDSFQAILFDADCLESLKIWTEAEGGEVTGDPCQYLAVFCSFSGRRLTEEEKITTVFNAVKIKIYSNLESEASIFIAQLLMAPSTSARLNVLESSA